MMKRLIFAAGALALSASCSGESSTDEQVAQLQEELAQANNRIEELEAELEDTPADGDESAETEAEETSTTTTAAPEEVGTRTNPHPLGAEASLEEWNVAVLAVTIDATGEVMDANEFNEAPEEGSVYALVRVRGTYTGPEEGMAAFDIQTEVVGDDQRRYSSTTCAMAVPPDPLYDQPNVLTGGTVEGNVCIQIPAGLGAPAIAISETTSFDADPAWWAAS